MLHISGKNSVVLLWAFFLLAVLLCGCGGREDDVILIGSAAVSGVGDGTVAVTPQPSPASSLIRVYVCGAVASPGVVEIPGESRAEDALAAAGGFGPDAAVAAVNLADWVKDGQMLYFPTAQEALEWEPGQEAGDGLVNINTADAALLCTLPGIGETRAADIIAYREKNGGFASCEDIMQVSGIKNSIYEKICDKITVK